MIEVHKNMSVDGNIKKILRELGLNNCISLEISLVGLKVKDFFPTEDKNSVLDKYDLMENEVVSMDVIDQIVKDRKIGSIILRDIFERQLDSWDIMKTIEKISHKDQTPIIVVAENSTFEGRALDLIRGKFYQNEELYSNYQNVFLTEMSLNNVMKKYGFLVAKVEDCIVSEEDEKIRGNYGLENSLVNRYIKKLKEKLDDNGKKKTFVRAYLPCKMGSEELVESKVTLSSTPFLTIITRTQGKRPEGLSEVLLSLSAQTDGDFELLIIGHKLEPENKKVVEEVIENAPDSLRKKIKFMGLDYGSRGTPLNIGFEAASGDYIVTLDDDDIVLDHWVETFHELAKKNPGTILYSYGVTQDWKVISTEDKRQALRATSGYGSNYCKDFNYLQQMNTNHCPLLGLAFPKYVYKELGIRFDESLDTTEDWDFLMRSSFLCGVSSAPQVTFIYRLWKNAESSATLHTKEEWEENRLKIIKKFDEEFLLLPKGTASKVNKLIAENHNKSHVIKMLKEKEKEKFTLYIDEGEGFDESNTKYRLVDMNGSGFQCTFNHLNKRYQTIKNLRLDPGINGGIEIENLIVELFYISGESRKLTVDKLLTNGFLINNKIVYLKDDPQVHIPSVYLEKEIEKIIITGIRKANISDENIDQILEQEVLKKERECERKFQLEIDEIRQNEIVIEEPKYKSKISYRIIRKIYRIFHRK